MYMYGYAFNYEFLNFKSDLLQLTFHDPPPPTHTDVRVAHSDSLPVPVLGPHCCAR